MGLLYEMVTNKREAAELLQQENRAAGEELQDASMTLQVQISQQSGRIDKESN